MKKLLMLILLVASSAFAVDFVIPEVQTKFDAVDAAVLLNTTGRTSNTALQDNSSDGLNVKRVARATWDYATDGGSVGAIDLGVNLPAKSLVNFAYMYFVTQVVDAGSGTGALHCEDANNLYSAADVTGNGSGTVVLGVPQNGAGDMVKAIAAECALTWTIASSAASAGKINFFVEYTITD